ncbi:hypothetical protein [Blautia massiliensis (ex Durand et al. 2017)]|uniref:hypothetical protein n=1 Tax=Blautia massiliensis (ex Durand et al. 2017) TaxID=1737424 RepID=UPI0018A06F4B|nr:hypothetical protein [Blautia massiliensis (ex Durand et al. 2017)]
MRNEMSLQDRYEYLVELNEKKEYTKLTGAFLKLFLDTNFKYMPENFDMLLSEDASMEEKETIAKNMLNAFKDALQKDEVVGLTVADNLLASDAELNFLHGLINADSGIDFLLSLINEQEYEKFAFHAQKYCLDNDINPKFPEDMETLIESGGSDDIKRDIAYEALTVLINAKNMSNTK